MELEDRGVQDLAADARAERLGSRELDRPHQLDTGAQRDVDGLHVTEWAVDGRANEGVGSGELAV